MSIQQHEDTSCTDIRACVVQVEDAYVITHPLEPCGDLRLSDSVTFSRKDWPGKSPPQVGQIVELIDTSLWRRGWRANGARPVTPQSTKKRSEA
jgi:hypothetical protein